MKPKPRKFRIRELAREKNMTLEELILESQLRGLGRTTVINIWQNKELNPKVQTLQVIANILLGTDNTDDLYEQ